MEASLGFMIALVVVGLSSCSTNAASRSCTRSDYARLETACDANTRTRSIVFYRNSSCEIKDPTIIPKPVLNLPCVCEPGQGLTQANKCTSCQAGTYSAGGDILDVWDNWSKNGTVPPRETGISVYCDTFRQYVAPCESWKASDDNEYLESGNNANTRCLQSVMTIKRRFVSDGSYVSFDYHVQGRKCYSNYVGCDGLSFYIDKKRVLTVGHLFKWTNFKVNVTKGYHQLKWIYRKNCYSYNRPEFIDKAYIKSIVMVGVIQPNSDCHKCPKGSFSNMSGSKKCTKCSYFEYQDMPGQMSCKTCADGYYAMVGDSTCVPLRNCTKDDIIVAPGDISTCKKNAAGKDVTTAIPKYHDMPELRGKLLCSGKQLRQVAQEKPCRCQPGFEVKLKSGQYQCSKCTPGLFSDDGITCKKCPGGQVALTGKHFYYWPRGPLPQGFTSECVGNCNNKGGWIPSGDVVRTGYVIGDVDSYIETPEYEVVSSVAEITFNCSIQCNVTDPQKNLPGSHLAEPKDCLLTLRIFKNGNITDSVNCTRPKGKYIYRHQNRRDGRTIFHRVRLADKGKYKFRWQFHQSDESRSLSANFEAKLSAISLVGVRGGEARNCTLCRAGYFNSKDGTDCGICDKGFYSNAGSDKCTACPDKTFAPKAGSSECLRCGRNTESNKNKDRCLTMGCKFSPQKNVVYDLNMLSRPGGPMHQVLFRRPARRSRRLSILPSSTFYVNLCSLNHTNRSCTELDLDRRVRIPIPTMACMSGWYSIRDVDIGNVIGYVKKKDITSGLTVELLHGDRRCWDRRRAKYTRYNTTIDMVCDTSAGVGQPMFNRTSFYPRPSGCTHKLVWKSLYACPKCQKEFFRRVVSYCMNGVKDVRYVKTTPCWGIPEGIPKIPVETELCNETTNSTGLPTVVVTETVVVNRTDDNHVAAHVVMTSNVNMVLIGVGVAIVVTLTIVAVFFFYKHRKLQYRYLSMATRNKPMSRLEEEEEDLAHLDGSPHARMM